MRTNNIKVTLEYKIPYGVPDLNGNVYTKEAVQKAIDECKEELENGGKLPILYINNSTVVNEEIIGIVDHIWNVQNNEIEQYYKIDVRGMLWLGGSVEDINDMDENRGICKGSTKDRSVKFIKDFKFVSFGISNFK